MKGVLNVLTAFLILVFVIFSASLGSISLSGVDFRLGPIRESEITINNEISSMRHALDAAGIYLDTALRFSVYQAMHDTGKNGGMPVIPEYRKATFSGRDYAVWYSTGLDISPSEEEILNGLVGLAKQSMDKYTSDDYAFLDEFAVTLPSYSSIDIRRADNGLTASADDAGTVIFIERKSGSSTVRLEKNPKISEDFDVDYSGLYKKSKETGRSVSDRLSDILNSKLAPLPGQPEPVAPEVTCGDKFSDLTGRNTDLAAQEIMDAVSNSPDLIFERQEGNFYIKSELLQNEISIDQKMEGASQPVCTYKYNIKIAFKLSISDQSRSFAVSENGKDAFANPSFTLVVRHTIGSIQPLSISKTEECVLEDKQINSFNSYKSTIDDAIEKAGLAILVENDFEKAEALVAGLIARESVWNPSAVSDCGAAGLMQFVPDTARGLGLSVPEYEFVDVCKDSEGKSICDVLQISACTACTPGKTPEEAKQACRPDEDQRFRPEESIYAGVALLANLISQCGNLDTAIQAYYSGSCGKPAAEGYVTDIVGRKSAWEACIDASLIASGKKPPAEPVQA